MKNMKILFSLLMVAIMTSCSTTSFYNLEKKQFNEIDYKYEVKKQQIENIGIAYIDEGNSDDVILLIHGLGSNAKAWLKNIPSLSENYRVIAVDLPGYGKSSKGYYKYSLSFYADVLTRFLKSLKVDEAVFVGHSMGGQISMVTALEFPGFVKKMVLISPAGFEKFTDGEGDWMKEAMNPEFIQDTPVRSIANNLHANFYETPEDAEFMIADRIMVTGADDFYNYCYAVSKNVAAMINEPVYNKLDEIKQKTLIIFGENDGLIPNPYLHGGYTQDIAKIGKKKIKNNKLVMLPECGHFAQFEKYEIVNEEILEFLK